MFTLDDEDEEFRVPVSLDAIRLGDVLMERNSPYRQWEMYNYAYSVRQDGTYEIYIQVNKTWRTMNNPGDVWINIGDGSDYLIVRRQP